MNSVAFLFLAIVAAAVAYMIWTAVTGHRSVVAVLVSVAIAALCGFLAIYAWTESHSLPWTVGYIAVAIGAIAASLTGWIRGGSVSAKE